MSDSTHDLLHNKKDRISRLSRFDRRMKIQQSTMLRKVNISNDNNASKKKELFLRESIKRWNDVSFREI
jgi:hypothetical protein